MPAYRRLLTFGFVLMAAASVTGCHDTGDPIAVNLPASEAAAAERLVLFDDVVALSNEHLTVEVSPAAGRLVSLIPAGGENLLWRASQQQIAEDRQRPRRVYLNWGGDKVWPALQAIWPRILNIAGQWPPIPVIDGDPWRLVDQSSNTLTIESAISPHLNVQVRRRIQLHPAEPRLTITNTLTRIKPSPFPVHIWSVSQVRNPRFALLGLAPDRPEPDITWIPFGGISKFQPHWTVELDGAIKYQPGFDKATKIGTFGEWIAGVWPERILLQRTRFDPRAAYPDGSNIQIYTSPKYTEIETLSPQVHLQPGESLTNTVDWFILDRPDADNQGLVNRLAALIANP